MTVFLMIDFFGFSYSPCSSRKWIELPPTAMYPQLNSERSHRTHVWAVKCTSVPQSSRPVSQDVFQGRHKTPATMVPTVVPKLPSQQAPESYQGIICCSNSKLNQCRRCLKGVWPIHLPLFTFQALSGKPYTLLYRDRHLPILELFSPSSYTSFPASFLFSSSCNHQSGFSSLPHNMSVARLFGYPSNYGAYLSPVHAIYSTTLSTLHYHPSRLHDDPTYLLDLNCLACSCAFATLHFVCFMNALVRCFNKRILAY